jgi:oxygen-independent coproporphyrinogen III oxidase
MHADDGTLGVYVHVPFCERICPYCDFAVVRAPALAPDREAAFVAAITTELDRRVPAFGARRLASLYFGGGTPSRLRAESIAAIVERVTRAVPAGDAPIEITLEVNPSTTERTRLPAFRAAGVDRLSIGIQSFRDVTLKRLGRAHRAAEGHATLAAARAAGFANVSLDLLFAAPGQTLDDLADDLAAALAFGPEHVSAYALTLEAGTPFERAARSGRLALPDDDLVAEMLDRVAETLGAGGLARYEVSSFARAGCESRHNRRYWERRPVLGVGPGAWSSEPRSPSAPFGARRANERDLATWQLRVERGADASAGPPEQLGEATARGEAVFLALRTARGLAAAPFAAEFGRPPRAYFAKAIDELVAADLLRESPDGSLALSPRGFLLSDSVFERFV